MPVWLPVLIPVLLWGLLAVAVLLQWWRYLRAARAGALTREELTAHVTADIIDVGVAVAAALTLHYLLVGWLGRHNWPIGDLALFLLYLIPALLLTLAASWMYHRFLDIHVRSFFLTEPAQAPSDPAQPGPTRRGDPA